MITRRSLATLVSGGIAAAGVAARAHGADLVPAQMPSVAEQAFIYGFPMVMNYGVWYQYFIDGSDPAFKAPFNQIYNTARVYTPEDSTIVTPNSDTPYSFLAMDLRAEPFVLCNPEIEKGRYFSFQFADMYTANFAYAGTRTTGNGPGCFMVAGPGWNGDKPPGITRLFRCETEFAVALIRTQLFNASDIDNVKKIQAGYRAEPLSKFLNKPAPPPPPQINWPKIEAVGRDKSLWLSELRAPVLPANRHRRGRGSAARPVCRHRRRGRQAVPSGQADARAEGNARNGNAKWSRQNQAPCRNVRQG